MAEALLWAGAQLSQRKEERKLLFVLTDGQPETMKVTAAQARHQARLVKAELDRIGIETMGIGIKIDISWLFDRGVKIDTVDALPGTLFSLMQTSLLKRSA